MIIPFLLQSDGEQVIVSAPPANIHEEIKNVVAYTLTKDGRRSIFAIGYDANDLRSKFPEEWAKRESATHFARPFDVGQFSSEFAVAFVGYCAALVHIKVRRHARLVYFIDHFSCDLEIKGYDTLSLSTRQEFEYALRRSGLTKIHHLTINGRDTAKAYQDQVRAARTLKWLGLFWIVLLLAVGWILLTGTISREWLHKLLIGMEVIAVSGAALLGVIGLSYIGIFLGALSTTLMLRRSMPPFLIKSVIVDARLGLPKSVANWLTAKMLSESS